MKKSIYIISQIKLLLVFLIIGIGCRDTEDITPTPINTMEWFTYTITASNGTVTTKDIDLNLVTAKYNPNTSGLENFYIEIIPAATNNLIEKLAATFYLQDFSNFIANAPNQTNYLWGLPGFDGRPTTSNTFFFTDLTRPAGFAVSGHTNNLITTTVTEYPAVLNSATEGYIAFNFTGTYVEDQNNPTITGTITGSARIKRTE